MKALCYDCEEIVSFIVDNYTFTEAHTFIEGANGKDVCKYCNCEPACVHKDIEFRYYRVTEPYRSNPEYIQPVSVGYHVYSGPATMVGTCAECGEDVARQVTVSGYLLRHDYAEDDAGREVCTICGQVNNCTHPYHDEEGFSGDDPDGYKIVDGEWHSYEGAGVQRGLCPDCGKTVIRKMEDTLTITENHEYNILCDGTLVCTICGHAEECSHPGMNIIRSSDGDVYTTTPLEDGRHHLVSGSYTESYVCSACGKLLGSRTVDEGEFFEEHTLENGKCTACGYELKTGCRHKYTAEILTPHRW